MSEYSLFRMLSNLELFCSFKVLVTFLHVPFYRKYFIKEHNSKKPFVNMETFFLFQALFTSKDFRNNINNL